MKHLATMVVTAMVFACPLLAQEGTRPAKVFILAEQPSEITRHYPAVVLPSQEVELSFRVSGNLIDLPIRGSMRVKKGDVIARVDTRDFEAQGAQIQSQLDQAQAELTALRTGARPQEIASLEAGVAAAQAEVDQAREQVERSRTLAERGTVAQAKLDQDEAARRVAEAQLRTQIEQLAIGREGGRPEEIDAAQAAIRGLEAQLETVRNNIADATLRAPFDGIIARRDVENFSNIQAGQSVALLQALAVVHLSFDVPAPDVTALAAGGVQNITNQVALNALPGQEFSAETVEFSIQPGSTTQVYRGRVAVQVPEGAVILPGMVGTVTSRAPGAGPEMTIPLTAVGAAASGDPQVWIVDDAGQVSQRPVTLGRVIGAHVVVTSGLQSGETIVSAGISALTPGMFIRPVTKIGG